MDDRSYLSVNAHEIQRRILELELLQVQRQAEVARLEAKAAEIERELHRQSLAGTFVGSHKSALSLTASSPLESTTFETSNHHNALPIPKAKTTPDREKISDQPAAEKLLDGSKSLIEEDSKKATQGNKHAKLRKRSSHKSNTIPVRNDEPRCEDAVSIDALPQSKPSATKARKLDRATPNRRSRRPAESQRLQPRVQPRTQVSDAVANEDATKHGSRRKYAMVASLIAHVGVLIALGLVGLNLQTPRDQVTFTASVSASELDPIESIEIESIEPAEPTTTLPLTDASVDLSPTGELPPSDWTPDDVDLMDASSLLSSNQSFAEQLSSSSDTTKTDFCGIEGGGNHFVYLVDSSRSMGRAFQSARQELIRSIQSLKEDQRFYVIFFDASPDYMRIRDAATDETASLLASDVNKAALAKWAAQVQMDDGRAPYEPLEFALQLNPDVIFLLSDGEFPARIEELLNQRNHVVNLFGERQRKSIVHTIGYHSQQGQERMIRIADQNGGKYRHIPKPQR